MNKLLIFLIFLSISCQAQVSKSISIGTSVNFGNLNSINLNVQSAFSSDSSSKVNWSINPTFTYTLINQNNKFITYERESYLTLSLSHKFGKKFKVIGFADAENSYLRKTLFRFSGGAGVGYEIVNKNNCKLSISEVIMPEIYISEDRKKNIISIRPSTRIKLLYNGERFKLESINYFQPSMWTSNNIKFINNINFKSNTTIEVPITKIISIGTQFSAQVFTLPTYFDSTTRIYDTNLSFLIKAYF